MIGARPENMCPVCGYGMPDPPVDFNICPCCGTEFGYEDAGRPHAELTKAWIEGGAMWWSPVYSPPDGWNTLKQLLDAGIIRIAADTGAHGVAISRIYRDRPRVIRIYKDRMTGDVFHDERNPCLASITLHGIFGEEYILDWIKREHIWREYVESSNPGY